MIFLTSLEYTFLGLKKRNLEQTAILLKESLNMMLIILYKFIRHY